MSLVRKGKFEVTEEMVASQPERVRQLMGQCIVTGTQHDPHQFKFIYTALSDHFTEVEEESAVPSYIYQFHEENIVQFLPHPPI